jgi:hypothetical protein
VSTSSETQEQEFDHCNDDFSTHFDEDDAINHMVHSLHHKHSLDHNIDVPYHITAEAAVSAAMKESGVNINRSGDEIHRSDDFGPPSPLHLDHHTEDDPF